MQFRYLFLLTKKVTEKNNKNNEKKSKHSRNNDTIENYNKTEDINSDKDNELSVKNALKTKTKSDADEESGMLSMDEVEDIICYNDMQKISKKENFLFNINDYKHYIEKNRRRIEKIFFKNENKAKLSYRNYYFGSGSIKGEQNSTPSTNFSINSKKKILK